ncbi:hypothetical protein [Methanosarcina sp.]|uniref:hypothetical protein n=1 Tax=Methanosarcina sp. TaxID=2213 RepID=UPI003C730EC6
MGGFSGFRDFDRFKGFGCGCGGGFDGGCGGGWGGWDRCGFRDNFKTKFFNIRGCITEKCGRGRGDWWD